FWCFHLHFIFLFFFNDPSTTQIYTLSLHDALPICLSRSQPDRPVILVSKDINLRLKARALNLPAEDYDAVKIKDLSHLPRGKDRSEEHTSELQSRSDLVCRLLLEKKNKIIF